MDQTQQAATNAPIKTYNLVNNHTFTAKNLEIHHNAQPILWINIKTALFHTPVINIHTAAPTGPIIAASKLQSLSRDILFNLGDPAATDPKSWPVCECTGWIEKAYRFSAGGRTYLWKRTHNRDIGGSTFGNKSFKLVDAAEERVVAVYVHTQSLFGKVHQVARIDYFVELGQELELASLAAMLGMQERIRRQKQSRGAAGGGGGAF